MSLLRENVRSYIAFHVYTTRGQKSSWPLTVNADAAAGWVFSSFSCAPAGRDSGSTGELPCWLYSIKSMVCLRHYHLLIFLVSVIKRYSRWHTKLQRQHTVGENNKDRHTVSISQEREKQIKNSIHKLCKPLIHCMMYYYEFTKKTGAIQFNWFHFYPAFPVPFRSPQGSLQSL